MAKEKTTVAAVKAELESVVASELLSRKFSYRRSDDSAWTLVLKDVVDRAGDLEMAYNLNEASSCGGARQLRAKRCRCANSMRQRASRAKMIEYRPWFQERRRPP